MDKKRFCLLFLYYFVINYIKYILKVVFKYIWGFKRDYIIIEYKDYVLYNNFNNRVKIISENLDRKVYIKVIEDNIVNFSDNRVRYFSSNEYVAERLMNLSTLYINKDGKIVRGTKGKWILPDSYDYDDNINITNFDKNFYFRSPYNDREKIMILE